MSDDVPFDPKWASLPYDTVIDVLFAFDIDPVDFVERMGAEDVATVRDGGFITLAIARKLSEIVGASVGFWMMRDLHYQQAKERGY